LLDPCRKEKMDEKNRRELVEAGIKHMNTEYERNPDFYAKLLGITKEQLLSVARSTPAK
jgi:hypothetical protein